jgi:hypothetical protein
MSSSVPCLDSGFLQMAALSGFGVSIACAGPHFSQRSIRLCAALPSNRGERLLAASKRDQAVGLEKQYPSVLQNVKARLV